MDLTATTIPKSDQVNAEDVMLSGPVTVTVESVSKGNAEQPVDIHLVEFPGRAYRPSKTMRRVLVKAWGAESDAYPGHRMTLYYDPEVRFGGAKVGGIKVSHVSHITKPIPLALTETRGKRVVHTVQPLPDAPTAPAPVVESPAPSRDDIATCTDVDQLTEWARIYQGPRHDAVMARVAALKAAPEPDVDPWATDAAAIAARDAGETA